MRVLFIGDIHFKHNNITETSVLMEKLRNLDEPYDFAVIAGDVLDSHEKIDVQLMNRAYDLIRIVREKSHVFICVGNHDMINNQQFLTDNHWMNGMKEWENVTIVDTPVTSNGFVFVPYVFPGRFVEALKTIDWGESICIFAHQEIKGCKMGAIESMDGDLWEEQWPLVISGHIHERQQPQSNVLYPGSVIDNGFSIFTFGKAHEPHNEMRLSLGIAPKKTVYVTAGQGIKVNDMIKGARIVISGTVDEIAFHKNSKQNSVLQKRGVKVVYRLNNAAHVPCSSGNFKSILENLVLKANDETLSKDFLTIISN